MRIVVTGREGQVARSLVERGTMCDGVEVITVARPQLDLTRPETIMVALAAARPDIVVSAAAYTAVDQAEDEPELARAINAVGAGAVAEAAAKLGVPVIHLSTDYVFDGRSERPYTEGDLPAPQSVYGATKLAGEKAVAEANPHHLILRTAWVYSPFGKNFVKTMLRLAAERDEIAVVADQWGNRSILQMRSCVSPKRWKPPTRSIGAPITSLGSERPPGRTSPVISLSPAECMADPMQRCGIS